MLSYRKRLSALALTACFLCSTIPTPARATVEAPETKIRVDGNRVYACGTPIIVRKDADGNAYIFDADTGNKLSDVTVTGSTTIFGGGFNTDVEGDTSVTIENVSVAKVYGGGYSDGSGSANVSGDTHITVTGTVLAKTTGGGFAEGLNGDAEANVTGTATSNIPSHYPEPPDGQFTSNGHEIYGGGYASAAKASATATVGNIQIATEGPIHYVYGGGYATGSHTALADCGAITIELDSADPRDLYCAGYANGVDAQANAVSVDVQISDSQVSSLYGGGYADKGTANVANEITLRLENCPYLYGTLYGGGRASSGGKARSGATSIRIKDCHAPAFEQGGGFGPAAGYFFAGGEASGEAADASVQGEASLHLENTSIAGAVFGMGDASRGGDASVGSVNLSLKDCTGDHDFYQDRVLVPSIIGGSMVDVSSVSQTQSIILDIDNCEFSDVYGGNLRGGTADTMTNCDSKLSIINCSQQVWEIYHFDTMSLGVAALLEAFEAPSDTSVTSLSLIGRSWKPTDSIITYHNKTGEAQEGWFMPQGFTVAYATDEDTAVWSLMSRDLCITATAGEHGGISPSGEVSVAPGGSQSFTVTPDAGYVVSSVLVDGAPAMLTDGAYTFRDVDADHTIAISFSPKPSGGSSGGSSASPSKPPVTTQPGGDATLRPEAPVSGGTARVEVSASDAKRLAEAAAEGDAVIAPTLQGEAATVEVALSGSAARALTEGGAAAVTVETPAASVSVPREALAALAGQSAKQVAVAVQTRDDGATEITLRADGKTVDTVPGGIRAVLPAPHASSGVVALLVLPDGTEQLVRKSAPAADTVTVPLAGSAAVRLENRAVSFPDSDPTWAKDAVDFATARGLMNGERSDAFAPNAAMTRGMLAAVLYRLDDEPEAGAPAFADVAPDAYYARAVAWARENNLMQGVAPGVFAPEGALTREQLAVILYHYAAPADAGVQEADFADRASVSAWAVQAVDWCAASGLLQGRGDGFSPAGAVTRAEAATVLQRLVCGGFV